MDLKIKYLGIKSELKFKNNYVLQQSSCNMYFQVTTGETALQK